MHGQKIDSLQNRLNAIEDENEKSVVQLQLSKLFERSDIAQSMEYANLSLKTSTNDSIKSESYNQLGRGYFYQNQLDSAAFHFEKSINLFNSLGYEEQASSIKISLGAVQLRKGAYKQAVNTLINGATFFEEIGDSINLAKCYSNVSTAFGELGETEKAIDYGEKALYIFKKKELVPYQAITLPNLASEFLKLKDSLKAKAYFLEAEKLALQRDDKFSLARIYNNLGNMYLETDHELSNIYLNKALRLRTETKNNDGIDILYNNLGCLQLKKGNYKCAVDYLQNALKLGTGVNLATSYKNLSEAYRKLGDHKSALEYSEKRNNLNDSISKAEHQKAITEISTKYETEKKEKEILNLQNKNLQTNIKSRQNRNLMYLSLALLALTGISAFSFIKNTKKKRIIAEQQQLLEHEKVTRLLKEQELIGIDAMLEGQEKERQRISEDLHDSLGGKLSALKLFIEDVKTTDKKLYTKIKTVLDESYNDVRNISHQQNASTIINRGLIPSVKMAANQLKSTEKLNIEVTNIDQRQKIKGFVELQLFRIIQELLTNTIKHAGATNVTIQFSEEDDTLNIVYEDDGIGFDHKKPSPGIGLKNIAHRIRKIGGSFIIDSSSGNGTTIILNVPV